MVGCIVPHIQRDQAKDYEKPAFQNTSIEAWSWTTASSLLP